MIAGGHFLNSSPLTTGMYNYNTKTYNSINVITHAILPSDSYLKFENTTIRDGNITGLDLPVNPTDVATKEYVDNITLNIPGDGLENIGNYIQVDSTVIRNNTPQTLLDDTQSVSPTTGALVIAGGVGIGKDVFCAGSMHAQQFSTVSDLRYKKNIEPIEDGLKIINDIDAVQYNLRRFNHETNGDKLHYGVLAQDLEEKGLKDMVSHNEKGDLLVNYNEFIGLLIKSVQQLTKKVETLEKHLKIKI